jgi:hypothetical protein
MSQQDGPSHRPPSHHGAEPPWVHGHAHEPNLQPPAGDGSFVVSAPNGQHVISLGDLQALPYTSVANCLIVSTGHGTSGPFTFGGVRLGDLIDSVLGARSSSAPGENTVADRGQHRGGYRSEGRNEDFDALPQQPAWHYADLVSADGFGTRLTPADLAETADRPVLLAYTLDGALLTRAQGLVRLIVPSETDDALRQVKWLATVMIV